MHYRRFFAATMTLALLMTLLFWADTAARAKKPSLSPRNFIAKSPPEQLKQQQSPLKKVSLGSMRSVVISGDIYLADQPKPADLSILKKHGIQTVITLRKSTEVAWDEGAAVKQQNMRYVEVPFQKPAELQPQIFDQVLNHLRDKERGPTLLHCGSANRVGAIWYAHRTVDYGLSPEAALEEAKRVGLRSPAYLAKARAYVEAVRQRERRAEPPSENR